MVDSSTRRQAQSHGPSTSPTSRPSARGLAMSLLARLKIAHKLLIFGAVLALPIVLLLYSAISGYNEGIRYTQKELEGARRLEPLRQLAEDVRVHQRLDYLRLKGDLRWEAQRKEAAQRIDSLLASNADPQLAARWQQLLTHPPATAAESLSVHQQLAAGVRDLLRELGDSSGLVLDPYMDSYYLMELTVTLLPDAQATIAKASMLATQEALGDPVSPGNPQLQFAIYADALESATLPQVRHAAETTLREDSNFQGVSKSLQQNLPGLLSRYQSALTTCIEQMRQYSRMPTSSVTAPQLAAATDNAAQAGWDFQRTAIIELQVLLNKRISDLRWKRTEALGTGILCAVTLLLLLWAAHQYHVRQLAQQFNLTLEARISERTRLARELQDTLLQTFQAVLPLFQTAIYKLPEGAVEARKTLESALDRTSEAIGEARDAVMELSMSTVEEHDLATAIRTIGEEVAVAENSQSSTPLQVLVEGTPRDLHPIMRDEIFRLAAEALRNAFRHAVARNIEVEIRYHEKYFRLRVRDDGKGISPDVLRENGRPGFYGLPGMRERAALMGGKLAIWSEVNSGTEIELIIPASRAYSKPTRHFWQFGKDSATDTDVNETIERE